MSFELLHKPTFTNQLLALSKEYMVQVIEKVERLSDDPMPDGKVTRPPVNCAQQTMEYQR